MHFQDHKEGKVWGEGVFENAGAVRAVQYLDHLAGLDALESDEEKQARADGKFPYSLYRGGCVSTTASEKVRAHLDSGVLHKLCKTMIANYFNPISVNDFTCHGFVPVMLAMAAMSHGCRTLHNAPGYHAFFKNYLEFVGGIFETAPMIDGAKTDVKKALYGPEEFKSGSAINFSTLVRAGQPATNIKPFLSVTSCPMTGGMPVGYKPNYEPVPMVEGMVGPCSKGDMRYGPANECGGCSKKLQKGMTCARCKDQQYCSKECQRQDYKRHKSVCRTPEDAEQMEKDSEMWMNTFNSFAGRPNGGRTNGIPVTLSMGSKSSSQFTGMAK
ncbi:hypothetical protein LTR56_001829 [Elasticomyces elasticus]|nr:hypothetical protein LTR56_001829 [Elasticomyces elasticus]KAK3668820.1 hypothetical protein LTR22_000300 [Elasticomyces elasticus]KAK4924937.1 hypothetical protein LTR49_007943 [Elasticomyces elasticus]KAK5763193.1 hypothetical protein LTS12_006577 [Elasticomyces elasticus]